MIAPKISIGIIKSINNTGIYMILFIILEEMKGQSDSKLRKTRRKYDFCKRVVKLRYSNLLNMSVKFSSKF